MSAAEELLMLSSDGSNYDKKEVVKATQEYLAERCGKELFGYSWGPKFGFLDKYTKGIQKGRTYRIGAVSNLGKTQFAYNICVSLMEQGKKVAFFTLENDRPFTVTNVMANAMGVNSHKVEDGSVNADFSVLDKGELVIIDDTYELGKVFAKVMELKPDVVILDYV